MAQRERSGASIPQLRAGASQRAAGTNDSFIPVRATPHGGSSTVLTSVGLLPRRYRLPSAALPVVLVTPVGGSHDVCSNGTFRRVNPQCADVSVAGNSALQTIWHTDLSGSRVHG